MGPGLAFASGTPDRQTQRGGSWNNPAENLRSAIRNRNPARNRNSNIGFRVVVSPPNTLSALDYGDIGFGDTVQGLSWRASRAECKRPARSSRRHDRRPSGRAISIFHRTAAMKRLGGLFGQVISQQNLWLAWRTFRRGKRGRPSVRAFEPEADRYLLRLGQQLRDTTYQPGAFRLALLREPKRRLIAAAPVRDRVVHHAIHRILAQRLDPGLIDQTYACLPGRGSHRAILAYQAAMGRYRYHLHLDIRHYFLAVHRGILIDEVMARKLKDKALLDLLRVVAESGAGLYRRRAISSLLGLPKGFPPNGCGLPIGNLTSQWWGNHYLSGLDQWVKRELKIPYYQRYMDDMSFFAQSRTQLEGAREKVANWLWQHRCLRLKKPGSPVRSTKGAQEYLGYQVSRARVTPGRRMLRRWEQRVGEVVLRGDEEAVERSLASYCGILRFGADLI